MVVEGVSTGDEPTSAFPMSLTLILGSAGSVMSWAVPCVHLKGVKGEWMCARGLAWADAICLAYSAVSGGSCLILHVGEELQEIIFRSVPRLCSLNSNMRMRKGSSRTDSPVAITVQC